MLAGFITVKTQKNREFFYLGLQKTSETTTHSGLGIKPGIKPLGLDDKCKAVLRNRLLKMKFLIIDKLSKVSSDLWADIDSRLGEISMMIP